MVDIETFNRLALAIPDVASKKHFRYDGFAVDGLNFAHIKHGDVYFALDRAQAEALANDHKDTRTNNCVASLGLFVPGGVATEPEISRFSRLIASGQDQKSRRDPTQLLLLVP